MLSSSRHVITNVVKVFTFLLISLHDFVHVLNHDEFISSTRISNIKYELEILNAKKVQNH